MLYGEGNRAFTRLQEEILKYSNDETLFAWSVPEPSEPGFNAKNRFWTSGGGLLADSPANFANCRNLNPVRIHDQPGLSLTNRGLCGELMVVKLMRDEFTVLAVLNAVFREPPCPDRFVGLYL